MPTGPTLSSVWWMIIAACATDAAVLGGIHLVARAGDDGAAVASPAPSPPTPVTPSAKVDPAARFATPPTAWAQCLEGKEHALPSIAAITYLDRGRDMGVTLGEVRGWIGKVPPSAVQIWRLEPRDPRMGRRIAFEVPQASWPPWLVPDAGLERDERCRALYHALRGHGVGRPRPADAQGAMDGLTRSRHDFEFLFPRRPEQYTAMVLMGTIADLTEARFAELLWWIDAPMPGTATAPAPTGAPP